MSSATHTDRERAKKLPLKNDSVNLIFAEHFIEHLSQNEAVLFLKEARRVLKKDGVLRVSTPDLEGVVDVYNDRNELVSQREVVDRHICNHRASDLNAYKNGCQFINDMFRLWGHRFIYDKNTLECAIWNAGFQDLKMVTFGEPGYYNFTRGLEKHANVEWMKDAFVMIYEAKK